MNNLLFILLIGIGATVVMDVWSIARKPLFGISSLSYGMVGRWIIHMRCGKFHHDSIAKSSPMRGEHIIGWTFHYLIGIAFAAILIEIYGSSWIDNPTIGPALTVGITTIAAPFLLMQPCMGAGIAASRTPNPTSARFHSLITHAIFGLGLYLSGWVIKYIYII